MVYLNGAVFLIADECGIEGASVPMFAEGGWPFVMAGQPSPDLGNAPRSGSVLPGTSQETLRFVKFIVRGRSAQMIVLAREAAARQLRKTAGDMQQWIKQVVDDIKDAND